MKAHQTNPLDRYTMQAYLLRRFDDVGRSMAFSATSLKRWKTWRKNLRVKLRELIGYDAMRRAPLNAKITEVQEFEEYRRQRVEIQTEPEVVMPMYVLIPKKIRGPFPAVMAPHGHCSNGKKAVVGQGDVPWLAEQIKAHDYDYGVQFAQAGFITFCPDARGFGERLEERLRRDDSDRNSCAMIQFMAYPVGMAISGMWAWDLHRLVDYIQTRKDCRPGKVGCAGLSGGGLQTLWASALDDRIRCSVISGYYYGYKDALLRQTCCACNYVPGLCRYADMGDIGALIAPRPLPIESGDHDPLNGVTTGLKNVLSQVAVTRKAYRLLDAGDALSHEVCAGQHKWYRTGIPWMQRWLME